MGGEFEHEQVEREYGGRRLSRAASLAAMVLARRRSASGEALAERSIQIGQAKRTATVTVYIGKTEDVRTDSSFVELTVGDPDVADVNPLTDRSLSILGKKNGTTRVSAYGEGKKLIGVFDVEVVYDTSLLQHELRRRFPHASLRVSAVNGRIMLSGTAPDGPTVDKAVVIAKQFGPDVINSVEVMQPQQVMLEVRFVEATRQAGRDLGVQWNVFGQRNLANIGNRTPSDQLPVTNTGGGSFSQPSTASAARSRPVGARHLAGRGGRRAVGHRAVRRDGQQAARGRRRDRCHHQRAGTEGRRPLAGRAESRRAVRRHRELPRRRRISDPGARRARHRSPSTTSATASASPSRRRC